jgi:hypothetical protein
LDELSPLPWLCAYQEDGPRLGAIVQRPVVPVALVGADVSTTVYSLVDSGCSHVLAAPWLADAAGIDPKASGRTLLLGIGGTSVTVEFADASLRLMAPGNAGDDVFVEWQSEVGFLQQWRPTWICASASARASRSAAAEMATNSSPISAPATLALATKKSWVLSGTTR